MILIVLLTSILSIGSTRLEPGGGSYIMTGVAMRADSTIIANEFIYINPPLSRQDMVRTDKEGRYEIRIRWTTWDRDAGLFPVDSLGNEISTEAWEQKVNSPIRAKYKNLTATAPNFWKEDRHLANTGGEGPVRELDLIFN